MLSTTPYHRHRPAAPPRLQQKTLPAPSALPPTPIPPQPHAFSTALQFGHATYREILTHAPAVSLNREQRRVLKGFDAMAKAQDLSGLPEFLSLLNSPEYRHLTNIVYHQPRTHDQPALSLYRKPFHSPFTDLYMALLADTQATHQILHALADSIRKPPTPQGEENAIKALVDIYFYALRPGGKAFQTFHTEISPSKVRRQQRAILGVIKTLLQDSKCPPNTRRTLRQELLYGLRDTERFFSGQGKRFTRKQTWPLITTPVPAAETLPPVEHQLRARLHQALRTGNLTDLKKMIQTGQMQRMIPEWSRIAGPDNHQHPDQDYTLQDHLLLCLKATQASPHYQVLSREEKFIVSTAAFFHDVRKRTGPPNLRSAARITADYHHPARSAELVRRVLPALGYTPRQVEDIYTLVEYHQALGNLAKPINPHKPTPERLKTVAAQIGTLSRLNMLKALTEGDVRCVRLDTDDRRWFTPLMAARLNYFADQVQAFLPAD